MTLAREITGRGSGGPMSDILERAGKMGRLRHPWRVGSDLLHFWNKPTMPRALIFTFLKYFHLSLPELMCECCNSYTGSKQKEKQLAL